MYYIIKKIGAERENAFLGFNCENWQGYWNAFKFPLLAQAKHELDKHENVVLLWVDESDKAPYGRWGEVNPQGFQTSPAL